jgi:hypothetical protein
MRLSHLCGWIAVSVVLTVPICGQTIQINRDNKTIAISTTDEATATADIAAVTVGYQIYGPDSEVAYSNGGGISHTILEALHKIGVDDKDVESAGQGVERNSDFGAKDTPEQRVQKQFVMRQSWTVSVPPQIAADVIRVAVAAGANQTGAIEWRISDRKGLQARAAGSALIKARTVASQMADGLHVRLGELIYASNQAPETREFDRIELAAKVFAPPPPLTISIPELEIRPQTIREEATVYAVFAIE